MKRNYVINKERAAVFVEFAAGMLLFFLLMIGIVDLGWMFHKRSEQEYAANQVVQLAAVMPGLEGAVAPATGSTNDVVQSVAMQRLRARASEVLTKSNGLAVSEDFHYSSDPFVNDLNNDDDYTWIREAIRTGDSSANYNPDLNYVRFSYPICKASSIENGQCKIFTDRRGNEYKKLGIFSIYLPAEHDPHTVPTKEALEEGLKHNPIVTAIDLDQSQSFLVDFLRVENARTRIFASAYREISTNSNMPLALGCDGKPLAESNLKSCPHQTIEGAFCDWNSYDAKSQRYTECWCDDSIGYNHTLSGDSCECKKSGNTNASYVKNGGRAGCHCEENESDRCNTERGWFFSASACKCVRHYCCATLGSECAYTTVQNGQEICNACNCGEDKAWEININDNGTMDCKCITCRENESVDDQHHCKCDLVLAAEADEKDDKKLVCDEKSIINDECQCEKCREHEIVDTDSTSETYNTCLCNLTLLVNKDKPGNENKEFCEGREYFINEKDCECEKCPVHQIVNEDNECVCNLTSLPSHTIDDGKDVCEEDEILDEKRCACRPCGKTNYIAVDDSSCACKFVAPLEEGDETGKRYEDGKYACKGIIQETENGCECVKCDDDHKFVITPEGVGACECNLTLALKKEKDDGKKACAIDEIFDEENCKCVKCTQVNKMYLRRVATADNQCECKYVAPRNPDDKDGKVYEDNKVVCRGTITALDSASPCLCSKCDPGSGAIYKEVNGEGICECPTGFRLKKVSGKVTCECDVSTLADRSCDTCDIENDPECKNAEWKGYGVCRSHAGEYVCENGKLTCEAKEDLSQAEDAKAYCCDDRDGNPDCPNLTCDKEAGRLMLCCAEKGDNKAEDCIVLSGYADESRCPADKPNVKYARNYSKQSNLDDYGCDTGFEGECRQGQFWCATGTSGKFECKPINEKAEKDNICNGKDDDCDGKIDEDYDGTCTDAKDVDGNLLKGVCAIGKKECVDGKESECQQVNFPTPSDNSCNGQDDDCDGQIDEDFQKGPRDCIIEGGNAKNACDHGARTCPFKEGQSIDQVQCIRDKAAEARYPQLKVELCDGIDNNCDGIIDNDDLLDKSCNTKKPGICSIGRRECKNGKWGSCIPNVTPGTEEEICDGLDNNCDGNIDEGLTCNKVECQEGENIHSIKGEGGNCYCDVDALKKICGEHNPYVEKDCSCGPKCEGDLIGSANGCICPANMRKDGDSCVCGDKATLLKDADGRGISCQCENSYEELDEEGNCRCKLDPGVVCKADEIYMVDKEANLCMCGTGCGDNRIKKKINGTTNSYSCENCDPGYTPDGTRTRCICTAEYMKLHPERCRGLCNVESKLKKDPNRSYKGNKNWIFNTRTCEWVGQCNEDDTGIGACICPAWMIAKGGGCTCPVNTVYDTTGQTYDCVCDDKFEDMIDKNGLHICSCNVLDCNTKNAASKATVDENGVLECTCGGQCKDDQIAVGENCVGCKGKDSEVKIDENGTRYCGCANDITYDPEKDQPCLCIAGGEMDKQMEAFCKEHKVAYLKGECKCDWNHKCGEVEICGDGIDNDCDGEIDEDDIRIDKECSNEGIGACFSVGKYFCNKETGQIECDAKEKEPLSQDDATCDGIDDNCNGKFDEDALDEQSCIVDNAKGVCAFGRQTCPKIEGEGWRECKGKVQPGEQEEVFDCKDNNCDGRIDEGFGDSKTCSTGLPGVCATGKMKCENGVLTNCIPDIAKGSQEEICDGLDNNCNDEIDEGFEHKVGDPCEVGKGECKVKGFYVCTDDKKGVVCDAKEGAESDEICDGKDNNCNGEIDEGFDVGKPCDNGFSGRCKREGVFECKEDGSGVECNAEPLSISAEDLNKVGKVCTNEQKGKCFRQGSWICKKDGTGIECSAKKVKEGTWQCSHDDNNCNGVPDDQESGHQIGEACYPEGSEDQCGIAGHYQCKKDKTGVECVGYTDKGEDGTNIQEQCEVSEFIAPRLEARGVLDVCKGSYVKTCNNGTWSYCTYSEDVRRKYCCDGLHKNNFKKTACSDPTRSRGEACDYVEKCNGQGQLTCVEVKKINYNCGKGKVVKGCKCECENVKHCSNNTLFNPNTCDCECPYGPMKWVCSRYNTQDCQSMCISPQQESCTENRGGVLVRKDGCNSNLTPSIKKIGRDGIGSNLHLF